MKAQLMIVLIGILATTATGCISQQDKETISQWKEFKDHMWAEASPSYSDAPIEVEDAVEESAAETETQAEKVEDASKQPAADVPAKDDK